MARKSECRRLLVAAMDFGTTYSGYGFSFTTEPMKVQTNQAWVAGSRQLISLKTPTCILLNAQKEFHSFGYQAENKYADLAMDGEHTNWYFFKHFKILLHNTEGLKQDTEIEDVLGHRMPAMKIFAWSIKYLKDHLMDTLHNRIPGIVQEDIHFVLTVPAIWDDKAKQYMRDAAVKAGISNDQLSIALEPEAAAIWCQQLELLKTSESGSSSTESLFSPGMRYMVVDLGGGTVDIAVHEIKRDRSLGELYKASGGPWGGTCVDKNFLTFIGNIVGQDVLQECARKHMSDYIELLREFETKKRTIKSGMDTKITITLPIVIKEIFEEKGRDVKKAIAHSGNEGKITWDRDKLRFDGSLGLAFFDGPIQSTIHHVRMLLSDPSLNNISTILLVGGFAECELVRETFNKTFKQKRIIIPEESGFVVLKGATLSGHITRAITTRIARFTYGINCLEHFQPTVHPIGKKVSYHGVYYCEDVFDKYVEIGETLKVGHAVTKTTVPAYSDQDKIFYEMFASTKKSPMFTTDSSCRLLGTFVVPVPEGKTLNDKDIERSMIFGDTEIVFKVKHVNTQKEFRTYFKYD
ncbi:hypothetical protein CHS0354_003080 [Potamilus streckersoni]|uniref:Heat shock 70 kDa protein 12A n=1 Tax=Potamilus streckersoni TaxID=2493646 RepID=A0AAE0RP27_9BIVA|nr:hypothetical protein CHS0354_003080 [Potamilus streckersoni]